MYAIRAFEEGVKMDYPGEGGDDFWALGVLYRDHGDLAQSRKCLLEGEERESGGAAFELARTYLVGFGVPKNETLGMLHLHKAARYGEAGALILLAYYEGQLKDDGAAYYAYLSEAAKTSRFAALALAESYCQGDFGFKDLALAQHYEEAAALLPNEPLFC
jgi:TPR repeat protein